VITFDFETKSYADLKKVGAWTYSQHPTTDIICASYGIDDEPIQSWWPGKKLTGVQAWPKGYDAPKLRQENMPYDLYCAIRDGHLIEAHNVGFEIAIWIHIAYVRYGWTTPRQDRWRDTMAVACYYAMPAGLDALLRAIGFRGKDPEGGRLITKYSKLYLKTAKTEVPEEDFLKFVKYCEDDVLCEQNVSDYLGDLPDRELEAFQLDLTINQRGLYLDQEGIDAATAIVEQRSEELTTEFRGMVGLNPTQRDKCIKWFAEQGLELENMQKDYLQELLDEGDLPSGPARRALEIRLAINKASTKKLDAMSRQRASDGRAHFQTRYHGACTGRWTGAGFQPLNLNRGYDKVTPEQLVRDIMYKDASWLDCIYGNAMDAVAKASRHWIQAQKGNKIVSGDFASIEAILLAFEAGEEWKMQAFRDGKKIYCVTADMIYKYEPGTVGKYTHVKEYKDGKTLELACGYQGALGAWLKFDNSGRYSDEEIIGKVKEWRANCPKTVSLWYGVERAAIEAVQHPGRVTGYGRVQFEVVDEWLSMVLPNGKRIWYFKPQVRANMPQWHKPLSDEKCKAGTCGCEARLQLCYMAQKEGQWRRVWTYGGKLVENYIQALSRELLVPAMLRVEKAGYKVILSVYDEAVSEVPIGFGSCEEFEEIMCQSPGAWADEYPLSVDAWEGDRYKK